MEHSPEVLSIPPGTPCIQVYILPTHPHITQPAHTHTHTLQNKLKQPQYKIHTK